MADITLGSGNQNGIGWSLDVDGECDLSDISNWGDPQNPTAPCGGYFPIIYINGSARMQSGGIGQGILLVEGDLDLRGGFEFYGVIIVQGELSTQGAGNRIYGGVMANNAEFSSQSMTGGSVVQYSSCSLESARESARTVSRQLGVSTLWA
jgi:hypothetical protein